jgi:hypothetical protein
MLKLQVPENIKVVDHTLDEPMMLADVCKIESFHANHEKRRGCNA